MDGLSILMAKKMKTIKKKKALQNKKKEGSF